MTNSTVILTREEIEIAEMFGLTIQQYAHGKHEIQRAQEEHEAWLQTPAGVEYMVKKEKETQEKLKKNREYARAYRARKRKEKMKVL